MWTSYFSGVSMMFTPFRDVTLCTVKLIYCAEAGCSDTSKARLDKLSWLFYNSWRRALSKTGTGDPRLLLGSEVYTSDLLDRPVGATWAQWPGRLHLQGYMLTQMTYLRVKWVQTSTSTRETQFHYKAIQSSQLDSCKFGILLEPVTSCQVPGGWICISGYTSKWGLLHSQGEAVAHLHRILSAEEKIGDQFLPK